DPALAGVYSDRPTLTARRTDTQPLEYVPADVPFYQPGQRGGSVGKGERKMQKPLSVEESVKHMVHPADLIPRLVVAEPDLGGKPIAMTWDERGRLLVAVTVDYPNELQPPGAGRDK